MISLSILDQSPVVQGETAIQAFSQTIRLAQEAEALGYRRFWVAEHHHTMSLAGSSPEVLLGYLAAKTKQIRLGSGGVMLPHYSPYKVAENFRVLEALAPDRIDLGLGRAPGGMPIATQALQEGKVSLADHYASQLDDLTGYLNDHLEPNHRFAGLYATPKINTTPEVWMLGSSDYSALLAAEKGAGFAFAHFINGDGGAEVTRAYRERFKSSLLGESPRTIVAIFAICGETEEEAERLAASLDLMLLQFRQGKRNVGIPKLDNALQYNYSPYEKLVVQENRKRMIVGSQDHVRSRILSLSEEYETNEFMIVTRTADTNATLKSYQLLAEAFDLKVK
ncbi:LLM class flavin-dependent oxidoreductase [Ammoniphilus sp. CFH 90114]|uniref:LLM class flavin-dependent oxidoreductase n=1 Tax=Ammoniphilus sp. CFH 90114 TaxID=2493665 RepID=UPI00100E4A97|nr:LLM class flavin-dependent oxidoreductase [Ammoniphilus sp. CFH 90114]RXT15381.1 LLM class flavin-dependent oxidoreductase [Ammoniphilus sp. CFH 90114]